MPGTEEPITKVVVHPIVLLSVVDHFYRMGKVGNQKRVVGVLLGSRRKGVLDVANSFAGERFLSYLALMKIQKNLNNSGCTWSLQTLGVFPGSAGLNVIDRSFSFDTHVSKKGKISAQPHTIVKQICFPNGHILFWSLFSLSKN